MHQWIGFIAFLLFLLGPVIAKAVNKMQEQAKEKAAIDRVRRRQAEALRTERTSEPAARAQPQARPQQQRASRPSLEELAAQRQAQLRELRLRQQQAARPVGTPSARQPDRLRPQGTRAPSKPASGHTGARVPGQRPMIPAQRPQRTRAKQQVDPRILAAQQREAQQRERLRRDAEYKAREEKAAARHRAHVAADDAKMDAALKLPSELKESMRINAADLRRIVLQAELIGKPLALRDSLDDRVL